MIYLVFYDISTDRLRNRIVKILERSGFERLQFSVFTGLENPVTNDYLWQKMVRILKDEPEAKLYVLSISQEQFVGMQGIGKEKVDLEYLAGLKRSLTI
ncbi:MAG: CRISPR-associated endonuclease Cas2 [Bacteroidales bacterium]|nr:CRISPR-associated endonuclease Cas2 [Bacteroidales bacterium]